MRALLRVGQLLLTLGLAIGPMMASTGGSWPAA
jgi:hypothetical protein